MLRTEAMAASRGHRLCSIGVTWSVFTRAKWTPQALVVVGSAGDLDDVMPDLEDALSVPVFAPAEADVALARGAALAAVSSPPGARPSRLPPHRHRSTNRPHRRRRRRWPMPRSNRRPTFRHRHSTFAAFHDVCAVTRETGVSLRFRGIRALTHYNGVMQITPSRRDGDRA
ncbi:DUF7159 family protein [Mycolicibacterium thermoresistibile]